MRISRFSQLLYILYAHFTSLSTILYCSEHFTSFSAILHCLKHFTSFSIILHSSCAFHDLFSYFTLFVCISRLSQLFYTLRTCFSYFRTLFKSFTLRNSMSRNVFESKIFVDYFVAFFASFFSLTSSFFVILLRDYLKLLSSTIKKSNDNKFSENFNLNAFTRNITINNVIVRK